jgi:hypothetical protein
LDPALVEVFWSYTGVSDIPSLSTAEASFDISRHRFPPVFGLLTESLLVLEPLVLGVIPEGTLPLIAFVIPLLALALLFVVPRLTNMFLSEEKAE